jgi:hypothetical protein
MTRVPKLSCSGGPRRTAKRVETFLEAYDFDWPHLIRLILLNRAPAITDVAGELVIFGEDEATWQTRERIFAALARECDGACTET